MFILWIYISKCSALVRNSQLPKSSKPAEIEEVSIIIKLIYQWNIIYLISSLHFGQVKNIMTATKVGFDHLSLDYTFLVIAFLFLTLIYMYHT